MVGLWWKLEGFVKDDHPFMKHGMEVWIGGWVDGWLDGL